MNCRWMFVSIATLSILLSSCLGSGGTSNTSSSAGSTSTPNPYDGIWTYTLTTQFTNNTTPGSMSCPPMTATVQVVNGVAGTAVNAYNTFNNIGGSESSIYIAATCSYIGTTSTTPYIQGRGIYIDNSGSMLVNGGGPANQVGYKDVGVCTSQKLCSVGSLTPNGIVTLTR